MIVRMLLVVLLLVFAASWGRPDFLVAQAVSPTVERSSTEVRDTKQAAAGLDQQVHLESAKNQLWFVMAQAAAGDEFAAGVAERFKHNTFVVSVRPEGDFVAHFASASQAQIVETLTPLAIMGPGELKHLENGTSLRGFVYRDGTFYYTATDLWTPWFLGAVALKQAVHWDSIQSGAIEGADDPMSPACLDAELTAHGTMVAAVDRHTGGALSQSVLARIEAQALELPLQPDQLPGLDQEELAAMTALAFNGEVTLNTAEALERSAVVATAYYLALVQDTPEAHQSVLRWLGGLKRG